MGGGAAMKMGHWMAVKMGRGEAVKMGRGVSAMRKEVCQRRGTSGKTEWGVREDRVGRQGRAAMRDQ